MPIWKSPIAPPMEPDMPEQTPRKPKPKAADPEDQDQGHAEDWKPGIHDINKGEVDPKAKPIPNLPSKAKFKKKDNKVITVQNNTKNKHAYKVNWS